MNNLPQKQLLSKTFDAMPVRFSSHEFVNKLVENGTTRDTLYTKYYKGFLVENCTQESTKVWVKKKNKENEPGLQLDILANGAISATENNTVFNQFIPVDPSVTTITEVENNLEQGPEDSFYTPEVKNAIALLKSRNCRIIRITEEEL